MKHPVIARPVIARLRNSLLASFALLTTLTAATQLAGCKPGNIEVETSYGTVAGIQDENGSHFLGIPYAKPPIGELRWADPQPPAPWTGVKQATSYGPACVQSQDNPLLSAKPREDCLTLNIWKPNTPGPHPVMFWTHGSANMDGSAAEPFYDGATLARSQNVVVVTIDFRLNVFGFFALPALHGSPAINGNQGIKDQIAALQWVHDEIANFGGDPGNVTVFGESTGAWNTCALMATDKTRTPTRLFHKAIMQSGYCERFEYIDLATAQQRGLDYITAHGCGDAADPLACARALPLKGEWFDPLLVIDGDLFPATPRELLASTDDLDIPLLIGSNKNEGSFVGSIDHPADTAGYIDLLAQEFPGEENALAALYPLSAYPNSGEAHSQLVGDQLINCGSLAMARLWSAHSDTWLYFFTYKVNSPRSLIQALTFGTNPPSLDTPHFVEVGFLFKAPILATLNRPSDLIVREFSRTPGAISPTTATLTAIPCRCGSRSSTDATTIWN